MARTKSPDKLAEELKVLETKLARREKRAKVVGAWAAKLSARCAKYQLRIQKIKELQKEKPVPTTPVAKTQPAKQ